MSFEIRASYVVMVLRLLSQGGQRSESAVKQHLYSVSNCSLLSEHDQFVVIVAVGTH